MWGMSTLGYSFSPSPKLFALFYAQQLAPAYLGQLRDIRRSIHIIRSTIIFLIDWIAFAGLSPFGQVLAQFMIVWQR